jgi:hypothetical protein
MKVNIIYLPYRRFHYAEVLIKILSRVKFRDFHVTVCGLNHHRGECQDIANKLNAIGVSASPYNVTTGWTNYMDKLKATVSLDYEYTIKLDEDIFLSPTAWDYFFESLDVLNDPAKGLLSPILSNGIPTVDNFIYKHMDPASKAEIERMFSAAKIPNLWGANYSHIDKLLRDRGYESDSYYAKVAETNHFYKGIHPIRVDMNAQLFLNQWIMDNFDKFFEEKTYTLEGSGRPYLCNSVFAMKSADYHSVIHDESLFRDCFDEVAVNNYLTRHNKVKMFISNNFGIHTMYNTVYGETFKQHQDLLIAKEEEFFQFIKAEVDKRL